MLNNTAFRRLPDNLPFPRTTEQYMMQKEQKHGEQELVEIAKKDIQESAWLYVPATSDWYNVCISHKEFFYDDGCLWKAEIDTREPEEFLVSGESCINYHTHPSASVSHFIEQDLRMIQPMGRKINTIEDIIRNNYFLHLAFPSIEDIVNERKTTLSLQNRGIGYMCGIASSMGITYLQIHDTGEDVVKTYTAFYGQRKYVFKSILNSITYTDEIFAAVTDMLEQKIVFTFRAL